MPPQKFSEISNSANLFKILSENTSLVIVKFGATWCGPCKRIQPIVSKRIEEFPENVQYYDIDIDDYIEVYGFLRTKKMVNGVPAILCWVKGNTNFVPDHVVIGGNENEVNKFFDTCKSKL